MGGGSKQSPSSAAVGWTDPADLSSLYFPSDASKENEAEDVSLPYYIGPVEIRSKQDDPSERGLFATTDIALGDPLLILPAAASACVDATFMEWKTSSVDVNVAAERVLVQAILKEQEANPNLLRCLTCLQGSGVDYSTYDVDDLLPILLGEDSTAASQKSTPLLEPLSEHQLQQIIRRNAFGPEFSTSFARVQQRWEAGDTEYRPPRFLGLYPLAAMINHSCVPNAIRVFVPRSGSGTDWMVVHACQPIPAGTELVWSYVPLTDNPTRHTVLSAMDFCCTCARCTAEAHIPPPTAEADLTVDYLEDTILPRLPSNEWRRYVRVGYLKVYLDAMNKNSGDRDWLPICTQLHLALASCSNASTEHLSILHWCYELAKPEQRTFWVQQLRTAIVTRYGRCGDATEQIRSLLQHTHTVVRNRNGMDRVDHKFI